MKFFCRQNYNWLIYFSTLFLVAKKRPMQYTYVLYSNSRDLYTITFHFLSQLFQVEYLNFPSDRCNRIINIWLRSAIFMKRPKKLHQTFSDEKRVYSLWANAILRVLALSSEMRAFFFSFSRFFAFSLSAKTFLWRWQHCVYTKR